MPNIFFSNKRKIFRIDDFKINNPLQIIDSNNYFLSCMPNYNIVNFVDTHDNSNRQKWIIEKHESKQNIYYIKCAFNRYNNTQYLGCPNLNNQVFLYTSKNKYTEWKIINIEHNIYKITYNGDKFNPKEVCMVVSRYSENIEWALAYNDITVIYNKGDKIKLPFRNIINLENNGREGHTYLYHIINNYDNLTDRCIFLQGNPIDKQVRNGLPDKFIKNRWGDQPPPSYKVEDYLFLDTFWVKNLRPSLLYCGEKYGKVETTIESDITMRDFFEKYVKCKNLQDIPEPFYWFQKGQFLCTKQNILSNSKEYYSHLIKSVDYTNNPIEGHYLERFWYYIFHRNLNLFHEQHKNIFTIWTRGNIDENQDVQSCFISMAENNPDKNVYILSNIIDKNKFIKYKNIFIVNYSLDILLTNTPAYNGYFDNIENIKTCKYWYSHETDLIRFVILYKYGGIYLDSDIFILKNIDFESIKNTLSMESTHSYAITGSAYLCYEKKHCLMEKVLDSFWKKWNKDVWHCVGPGLLDIFRNEINFLDYYYFYPISYGEISYYGINSKYLEKNQLEIIENISKSYGIHLWNSRFKKHMFNVKYKHLILDTNSFVYKLIQKNIPDFKLEETHEIILDNNYKLVQHEKINTLHSLYNISTNKYYVYNFKKKNTIYDTDFVDKNYLSTFIYYSNKKILCISLEESETFHEIYL